MPFKPFSQFIETVNRVLQEVSSETNLSGNRPIQGSICDGKESREFVAKGFDFF
jgi:hypothetical protein